MAYGHRDALFYHQAYAITLNGRESDKMTDFLTGSSEAVAQALLGHDLGAYRGVWILAWDSRGRWRIGEEPWRGFRDSRLRWIRRISSTFRRAASEGIDRG